MLLEDLLQNGLCGLAAAERGEKGKIPAGLASSLASDNWSSHLLSYVISFLMVKVNSPEAFELQLAIIMSKTHALNTSPHSPLYASPEGKKDGGNTPREPTWY